MAVDNLQMPVELRIRWWATWLSKCWCVGRRIPILRRLWWWTMVRGCSMKVGNGPWQRMRSEMPKRTVEGAGSPAAEGHYPAMPAGGPENHD